MAKRRRRAATATRIVRVGAPRAPAPIIKVTAPSGGGGRRRHHRRRRSRSGGYSPTGLVSNESFQMAIGGALYGFAFKAGIITKLPEIPLLGRTGTAAIILDYWSRHGGGRMVRSAAHAAAAIAGYQLGAEGRIQGDAGTPVAGDFMMGDMEGDEASGDYE
jgi:hypothetical protein